MKTQSCHICGKAYQPFMSFGRMPNANSFLLPEQFKDEYFYELKVAFCDNCGMFQVVEQPEREKMFHGSYAFFSGTSRRMELHFSEFAESVISNYLPSDEPFVVEIGSNDGTMLQNFARRNIRHLGVEPSSNVALAAEERGVRTICEFFDEKLAGAIVKEHGQVDAFMAANCMCHIRGLHSVIEGIRILLKPDGVAVFEDPYLGDLIEKTSYDQIYDAHVFIFSVSSIERVFSEHGLELTDIEHQDTHGGSMRYVISHKGRRRKSERVIEQLQREKIMGLDEPKTYEKFRANCENSRDELISLLRKLKKEGRRIAGYAATAKSTTVINYCGITPELIDFISDTTPLKQGKFSPGMHIPVKPHEEFTKKFPDYALLFAWNHAEEIMAKEKEFTRSGGKWILHVPQVRVL